MALFRAKFACNLAISNHVFRWESCKGSMWESVKKCSRLCKSAGTRDWDSRLAHGWQAARWCTRVKHAEKMNSHANWSTTGQKVQFGNSVCSRLELATQSSHETKPPASFILKNMTFHTHEILRASRENIERETLEKNEIDLSTIFT